MKNYKSKLKEMVVASLEKMNELLVKYEKLVEDVGDTKIIKWSHKKPGKIFSNKLIFEEENVYLYLFFNSNIKEIKAVFVLTEIDEDYVEMLMSRIGLPTTQQNVENYSRDPTMIEKYWNDRFKKDYKDILKKMRRQKITYRFIEKLKPAYNKNRYNEIVF